jgi:exodeoxyribonuclease VII small subunit
MEAKTFREAYEVLKRHATTLREQQDPNIDDLLDIVNESVAAYKVCKQRIDAVEKALELALVDAGLEPVARQGRREGEGPGSS